MHTRPLSPRPPRVIGSHSTHRTGTTAGRVVRAVCIVAAIAAASLATPGLVRANQRYDEAQPERIDRTTGVTAGDARRVDRRPEILRLRCTVRRSDVQSGVVCRWSAPTSDGAVGVRLLRATVGSNQRRSVVYRSSSLAVTEHQDVPVPPGHRYVYVVQALDGHGRIVGRSRPVTVSVPPPAPDRVEVLRLSCEPADIDASSDRVRIGCEWSLPTAGAARVLALWRSVDGGPRELVVSYQHRFESSYRDVVPGETAHITYAVVATNGEREIVARSRPATVALRDDQRPQQPSAAEPDVIDRAPAPSDDALTKVTQPESNAADVSVTSVPAPVASDVPAGDVPARDVPAGDEPVRDAAGPDDRDGGSTRRDGTGRDRPAGSSDGSSAADVVSSEPAN